MKRITTLLTAAAVATFMGTSAVQADILKGSPGYKWQDMPDTLNNYVVVNKVATGGPMRPFWDNPSRDTDTPDKGAPLNVGNYLSGSYRFKNKPGNDDIGWHLDNLQWWGSTGTYETNADRDMYFTRGASEGEIAAQMLMQSAGGASKTSVGWYDVTDPTKLHEIWNGRKIDHDTVYFTPSENWGFYVKTSNGTIFYMDSSLNTKDQDNCHFAIFQDADNDNILGNEIYYVGIEDMPAYKNQPEGLGDFNDFVFTFWSIGGNPPPPPHTPEPASLMILGLGVAGLLIRRK